MRGMVCSLLLLLVVVVVVVVSGYSVSDIRLNRHVIAGLWKLTTTSGGPAVTASLNRFDENQKQQPRKEFTVYPKKPSREYYFMLNPDGSYRMLLSNVETKGATGVWDYRDGKLLLAADRQPNEQPKQQQDLLLEGQMEITVPTTRESHIMANEGMGGLLYDNEKNNNDNNNDNDNADLYLRVSGNVQVGRFMYPKKHSRFFEQPMFQPIPMGGFVLRQVMGHRFEEVQPPKPKKPVEKFSKDLFADKRFYLTTQPLKPPSDSDDIRRNRKGGGVFSNGVRNMENEDVAKSGAWSIRAVEVTLFANLTFCSVVPGLGGTASYLRGKWDILGEERDRLWMQTWRYGFGRSVSGSTYSEGRFLSHEDTAKSYWGNIRNRTNNQLEVQGSVMVGYGLEPQPVARFLMRPIRNTTIADQKPQHHDDGPVDRSKLPKDPPAGMMPHHGIIMPPNNNNNDAFQ